MSDNTSPYAVMTLKELMDMLQFVSSAPERLEYQGKDVIAELEAEIARRKELNNVQ